MFDDIYRLSIVANSPSVHQLKNEFLQVQESLAILLPGNYTSIECVVQRIVPKLTPAPENRTHDFMIKWSRIYLTTTDTRRLVVVIAFKTGGSHKLVHVLIRNFTVTLHNSLRVCLCNAT